MAIIEINFLNCQCVLLPLIRRVRSVRFQCGDLTLRNFRPENEILSLYFWHLARNRMELRIALTIAVPILTIDVRQPRASLSILGRWSVPSMDLSWFSCEKFLPFLVCATICDLCRALFPPRISRDSTKTATIATIGRCSALCYDHNSKARSTKEIRRIDNSLYSSPCCGEHLSVFVLRFSARSNFHLVQDFASPPFLRIYPAFG